MAPLVWPAAGSDLLPRRPALNRARHRTNKLKSEIDNLGCKFLLQSCKSYLVSPGFIKFCISLSGVECWGGAGRRGAGREGKGWMDLMNPGGENVGHIAAIAVPAAVPAEGGQRPPAVNLLSHHLSGVYLQYPVVRQGQGGQTEPTLSNHFLPPSLAAEYGEKINANLCHSLLQLNG